MKLKTTYPDNNNVSQNITPDQSENALNIKNVGQTSPINIKRIEIKISLMILLLSFCFTVFMAVLKNERDVLIAKEIVPIPAIITIVSLSAIFLIISIISQLNILVKCLVMLCRFVLKLNANGNVQNPLLFFCGGVCTKVSIPHKS